LTAPSASAAGGPRGETRESRGAVASGADDLEARPARFDPALRAWVLSRYGDVVAALADPALAPPGTVAETNLVAAAPPRLEPVPLAVGTGLERSAEARIHELPADRRVDLVGELAAPWSVELALRVTGAPLADADAMLRLSRTIFLAAAHARGPVIPAGAAAAAAELAERLRGAGGPLGVQAWVALTQTLPHLIGATWYALFRHPERAASLREEPGRIPRGVEELLRLAGPARAVFRSALRDTAIGTARIAADDLVILLLAAANRDPFRFPEPDRLLLDRRPNPHLAFGAGAHACAGASVVRAALVAATAALLRGTAAVEVSEPTTWIDGFAIRAPASLPAVVCRAGHPRVIIPAVPRDRAPQELRAPPAVQEKLQ
jgi:hypothetical protein